ncbi:calcium-transporting ATPase 1, endoplasmic reticulum-type-like [Panicum miliaceum]|uniref:Calcium-transporting ATPase 1, endoplasmic reticulum-type-like n=1 Tax=Panicum miliaceum TaxID=4540 RepID=A0A3L6SQK4_PANMI|nr:calcium-transporting ATPase 1, endoplasmic reticulum-type-like [Panicum miliaceum]
MGKHAHAAPQQTHAFPAWARTPAECEAAYAVSAARGLSSEEAVARREAYGPNELGEHPSPSLLSLLLAQFDDTLVRVLLAAAAVSFALAYLDDAASSFVEPLVIFLILLVNAAVGAWQETSAERALAALKEIQCEHAAVRRDGVLVPRVAARELVPGDVVELRAGDRVPADVRVLSLVSSTLRVEQASLTGESEAVNKTARAIAAEDAEIQAKEACCGGGPRVWASPSSAAPTTSRSPVALAVAAIPEGLPTVITTCLALGTRKMAQKNALVRIPSVETLGCTTVICSDKTGTLTTNQMSAVRLVAMPRKGGEQLRSFRVEGTTYDPMDGRIDGRPEPGAIDENLAMVARIAAVCNDASISLSGQHYVASGMPTEAALKGAVENLLERCTYMQLLDGNVVEMDGKSRGLILESLREMSRSALRCLGFAYKDEIPEFATYDGEEHPAHKLLLDHSNYSSIENNLIFAGFVGLRDPPREEVPGAIEKCKAAGIRVIVITGDNKETAEAICHEIGVFSRDEDLRSKSFTGRESMSITDKKSKLRQQGGLSFSRAEPKHKQEIVRLLKEDGEVVAMTGDGANDAPALKLADIGIAMGIAGTELLWVNLVTDGPPATALGFNPPDKDIMKKPLRRSKDSLISAWILFRYMLSNWGQCSSWEGFKAEPFTAGDRVFSFDANPCDYFTEGKAKATTISLSVLVAIEMFNSLNALSEDASLLTMPPWVNPWLLLAMAVSFGLHFLILYTPFFASAFGIVPLSFNEWMLVLVVAFPVIIIDEVLKLVRRCTLRLSRPSMKLKAD